MLYDIKNLCFSYRENKQILDNISLEINEGELLCVLGKNGSGKTTFFNCMLGLLKNYQGNIYLNNADIKGLNERSIAKLVSYVPQNPNSIFGYTVLDYVLMGLASNIGIFSKPSKNDYQKALDALKQMDILDYSERMFNELSGGEKQQVTIARAIVSDPKIIFFDEPTAHLDYVNQIKVLKMIKELSNKGFAVVFSTHDPNHALILNSNVALFDGKGHIEKGTCEKLITEKKLNKIYDSNIKITYVDKVKRKVCTYKTV